MFAAHIHQVRGSRLGEVEVHAVTEAPRKPAVSSGAAIARRRALRPVLRVMVRSAAATPPLERAGPEGVRGEPERMRAGYRTAPDGRQPISVPWGHEDPAVDRPGRSD